jgi:hypothetical protein
MMTIVYCSIRFYSMVLTYEGGVKVVFRESTLLLPPRAHGFALSAKFSRNNHFPHLSPRIIHDFILQNKNECSSIYLRFNRVLMFSVSNHSTRTVNFYLILSLSAWYLYNSTSLLQLYFLYGSRPRQGKTLNGTNVIIFLKTFVK